MPKERFYVKNPANVNPSEVNKLLQENEYLQKRLTQAQELISDMKMTLMSTTPFEPMQDKACQKAERWLNQREDLLEEKK